MNNFLQSNWGSFMWGYMALIVFLISAMIFKIFNFINKKRRSKYFKNTLLLRSFEFLFMYICIFSIIIALSGLFSYHDTQFSSIEYDVNTLMTDLEKSGIQIKTQENKLTDHNSWLVRRRYNAFGKEKWIYTPEFHHENPIDYEKYRIIKL